VLRALVDEKCRLLGHFTQVGSYPALFLPPPSPAGGCQARCARTCVHIDRPTAGRKAGGFSRLIRRADSSCRLDGHEAPASARPFAGQPVARLAGLGLPLAPTPVEKPGPECPAAKASAGSTCLLQTLCPNWYPACMDCTPDGSVQRPNRSRGSVEASSRPALFPAGAERRLYGRRVERLPWIRRRASGVHGS